VNEIINLNMFEMYGGALANEIMKVSARSGNASRIDLNLPAIEHRNRIAANVSTTQEHRERGDKET
jgi:hypothetical protein